MGILALVTGFFSARGCNLLEAHQFTSNAPEEDAWFFTRLRFAAPYGFDLGVCRQEVEAQILQSGPAEYRIVSGEHSERVALLVSREGHCLSDLLWRWQSGSLKMTPVVVLSNHKALEATVRSAGVEFVHVNFVDRGKAFVDVGRMLDERNIGTVVLARFMQIVPGWLCRAWENRILNIHHSFLPAFAGANPYRRAHLRGVKLIGATCHYVTEELDAGPIIEQDVTRVEHYHTTEDMVRLGQDCERMALARGLTSHLQHRVFVHNGRTVILD